MSSTAPSTLTHHDDTYPFIEPSRFANHLTGKTVLITGAGRGIGRAIARAFATAGARVVCVARRQNDIDSVAKEINELHRGAAAAVTGDVMDPESPAKVLAGVEKAFGSKHVDVLVNNAGTTRFNTFEAEGADLKDWWKVFQINLFGSTLFARAVLPSMLQKKSGVVISMASTSGSQDIPFNTAYASSKAAIMKWNQDLSVELEGTGVRCYTVHPGTVATDLAKQEGVINMELVMSHERMRNMMMQNQGGVMQQRGLAAGTIVALTCEDGFKEGKLSGRYIDSEQDLGEVMNEVKKEGMGRVGKEKLYWLKLQEL